MTTERLLELIARLGDIVDREELLQMATTGYEAEWSAAMERAEETQRQGEG
jgi:hypothetical protein